MKKLLPLPVAIFPYIVCGVAGLLSLEIFGVDIFAKLFTNSFLVPLFFLLVIWFFALVCAVMLAKQCTYGARSTQSLVRLHWMLKMAHMPAHCILFVLLCLAGGTGVWILFWPIVFAALLFGTLSLILTGVIGVGCVWNCWYECKMPTLALVLIGISQFVFFLDMLGALVLFIKVGTALSMDE